MDFAKLLNYADICWLSDMQAKDIIEKGSLNHIVKSKNLPGSFEDKIDGVKDTRKIGGERKR